MRKSQTARYHPGSTVPCTYDGWITGTWSWGVSLKLESESKLCTPRWSPQFKTLSSGPGIWKAGMGKRERKRKRRRGGSELSEQEAEPACRRQIQRECKGPSFRFDFLGPRKVRQKRRAGCELLWLIDMIAQEARGAIRNPIQVEGQGREKKATITLSCRARGGSQLLLSAQPGTLGTRD